MGSCVTAIHPLFIHFLDFLKNHSSKEKVWGPGDTTICLALFETLIILELEPHRKVLLVFDTHRLILPNPFHLWQLDDLRGKLGSPAEEHYKQTGMLSRASAHTESSAMMAQHREGEMASVETTALAELTYFPSAPLICPLQHTKHVGYELFPPLPSQYCPHLV